MNEGTDDVQDFLEAFDLPNLSIKTLNLFDIYEVEFLTRGQPYLYSSFPLPRMKFKVNGYGTKLKPNPTVFIAYLSANNIKRLAEAWGNKMTGWIGKKAKVNIGKFRGATTIAFTPRD